MVELLVLLAIFGLLAAIMIPVASVVRDHARAATCTSNLGKLMNGMFTYAEDHEGVFPAPSDSNRFDLPNHMNTWHAYLAPYVGLDDETRRIYASGITWRSDSFELTAYNCPVSMEELKRMPDAEAAHLDPWYLYGLNATLPAQAGLGDRRSGNNVDVNDLDYPAETMAIMETPDWSAMYHREIGNPAGTGNALIPHGMAANVAFYDGSVRRIPYEELIAYEESDSFWSDGFAD